MSQGYFARLGVKFGADRDLIDKNYKKLARKYHPDKNTSLTAVEEFQKITTACAPRRSRMVAVSLALRWPDILYMPNRSSAEANLAT